MLANLLIFSLLTIFYFTHIKKLAKLHRSFSSYHFFEDIYKQQREVEETWRIFQKELKDGIIQQKVNGIGIYFLVSKYKHWDEDLLYEVNELLEDS